MKKLTVFIPSIAFIMLLAVTPVFAQPTTIILHYNAAVWSSVIAVPGHPIIGIVGFHDDGGYVGCGDAIQLNLWVGPPYFWMTLVSYTDNPSLYALQEQILPPQAAINLVKPWQIQVCRIGKIGIACWTMPLVAPATPMTPAVTVPPGCLVLKGYGDVFPMTLGPVPTGTGWTITFEAQNYAARETLICPGWHYCGQVGTGVAAAGPPNISVEGTRTFYHP